MDECILAHKEQNCDKLQLCVCGLTQSTITLDIFCNSLIEIQFRFVSESCTDQCFLVYSVMRSDSGDTQLKKKKILPISSHSPFPLHLLATTNLLSTDF